MDQTLELQYAPGIFYFLVCSALVMWMAALFAVSRIMYLVCGYALMYDGGIFLSGIELDGATSLAGVLVVFSILFLDRIRIDDPVGAISVHGTRGLLGPLLVPLTNSDVTFVGQIAGALTIFGWVFAASTIVWLALKITMGIRVSEGEEFLGVDVSECGIEAYPEFVKA